MIRRCGPAGRCTSLDFEFWSLLLFSVCSTSCFLLETEPSAAAPTTSYLLSIIMNSDPLKLQAPINSPASHFGHSRRKAASISEIPFCTFKAFTPWDELHRPTSVQSHTHHQGSPRMALTSRTLMLAVRVQQHGDRHAHILGSSCYNHISPKCFNSLKKKYSLFKCMTNTKKQMKHLKSRLKWSLKMSN